MYIGIIEVKGLVNGGNLVCACALLVESYFISMDFIVCKF